MWQLSTQNTEVRLTLGEKARTDFLRLKTDEIHSLGGNRFPCISSVRFRFDYAGPVQASNSSFGTFRAFPNPAASTSYPVPTTVGFHHDTLLHEAVCPRVSSISLDRSPRGGRMDHDAIVVCRFYLVSACALARRLCVRQPLGGCGVDAPPSYPALGRPARESSRYRRRNQAR